MLKKQPCCSLYLQTAKKRTLSLRVFVFNKKKKTLYLCASVFKIKR